MKAAKVLRTGILGLAVSAAVTLGGAGIGQYFANQANLPLLGEYLGWWDTAEAQELTDAVRRSSISSALMGSVLTTLSFSLFVNVKLRQTQDGR